MEREYPFDLGVVVDDDPDILIAARLLLRDLFREVVTLSTPDAAVALVRDRTPDVVLLDANFARGATDAAEGLALLDRLLGADANLIVVMITAHAGVNVAVEAMKRGATDFVSKPWSNQRLLATVRTAAALSRSRRGAAGKPVIPATAAHGDAPLIGDAPAMARVRSLIARAAPTDVNVLVLGENGTGKELVARALHAQSRRASRPMVTVDLGATATELIDSELFGHVRGAFTDAKADRVGRIQAADGGTLFLDEIGNLPLALQPKLLTALEQRTVTPVGSNRPVAVDIRVIAATNLSPEALRDPRQFRQDLLFRLNTVEIELPPLRERREDVPALLDLYLSFYAHRYGRSTPELTAEARAALTGHDWPGNVRALRHAVERAVVLSGDGPLTPADFPLAAAAPQRLDRRAVVAPAGAADLNLDRVERRLVEEALRQNGYNISAAAAALGLSRAALYRGWRSMASDRHFGWWLAGWTAALTLAVVAFAATLGRSGLAATRLVAAAAIVGALAGLVGQVRRTNVALARFTDALTHGDFQLRGDGRGGAGFDALGRALTQAMRRLQAEQLRHAEELRFWTAVVDDLPVALLIAEDGGAAPANKAARTLFDLHRGGRAADFAVYGDALAERPRARRAGRAGGRRAVAGRRAAARPGPIGRPRAAGAGGAGGHGGAGADGAGRGGGRHTDRSCPRADARDPQLADPGHVAGRHHRGAAGRGTAGHGRSAARGGDPGPARGGAAPLHRRLSVGVAPAAAAAADLRRPALRRGAGAPVPRRVAGPPSRPRYRTRPGPAGRSRPARAAAAQPAAQRRPGHGRPPRPAIRLGITPDGAHGFRIDVEDNGPGIPERIRGDIFLPFFTTRSEGGGIGLNLARQIAVAHDWRIDAAASELGRRADQHTRVPDPLASGVRAPATSLPDRKWCRAQDSNL